MNQAKPRPDHEKAAPGWTPRSGDKTIKRLENSSTTAPPTARSDFSSAMAEAGLPPPDIIPDGVLHRFTVPGDRPGTRNGYYLLHLDGVAAGAFGSWKTGLYATWSAQHRPPPDLGGTHPHPGRHRRRQGAASGGAHPDPWRRRRPRPGPLASGPARRSTAPLPESPRRFSPTASARMSAGNCWSPSPRASAWPACNSSAAMGASCSSRVGRLRAGTLGLRPPTMTPCLSLKASPPPPPWRRRSGIPAWRLSMLATCWPPPRTMHRLKPDARIVICGDNDAVD
jgi:hypothetical protein